MILTAESVCMGHPDKLCDLIADSVLDACLKKDKNSRVACEVMATKGRIIVAGEITCSEKIDIPKTVKKVLRYVGYNPKRYKIHVYVQRQSEDIANGISRSLEAREGLKDPDNMLGAGDQGIVYGYATDETPEKLPLPLVLAHRIVKRIDDLRMAEILEGVLPDGKAQVSVEYKNGKPKRVKTIVVSVQHEENRTQEEIHALILEKIIKPIFSEYQISRDTEILINPSGRFVTGGPEADTGVTGRKLMVDTYGGLASHGGGALCGKDPTKVDRSGAYMARYIAKNIVWSGLAKKCEVALSFAIGKANPVAFSIDTFGTGKISDCEITSISQRVFNFTPAAIIENLKLLDVTYADTAVYGHFNKCPYPWENINKFDELIKAVGKCK